jgi:hypothetical protein
MRLSIGAVMVLALLPIALSVVGFYSAHFILSAPPRVDWVSLGAPPGGAVEFVDQKNLIRGADGKIYWPDGNGWSLKSDQSMMATWEFDESCPAVVFPKGTVDEFQECYGYSDDYYAILEDGTFWYYTTGGDDEFKNQRFVVEFIVKVIASVVGLAFGVGILAFVGIMGKFMPIKLRS